MAGLLSHIGVGGGNPFTTLVGQRIEQATDGSLPSENWALNMEICDIINETDEGPKDAMKCIRKKLVQNAGKNQTVVMYTLTILEACVKNCGRRFQILANQKDFVQELVKIIGPKNDPPPHVQEKVLSMIQSWNDTFHSDPEMQGVVQVYNDLKQKGIDFPDGVDTAPINTPSRSIPVQQCLSPRNNEIPPENVPAPAQAIHPQQLEKLKKELEIVSGNMKVFNDMLTELTPGKEHESDLELLRDLYRTCQTMQSRIVELLDRVGNEKITEDLLKVNDELNNLFLRYDRFEKKRLALKKTTVVQENPTEPKLLIDFGDDDATNNDNINKFQDLKLSDNLPGNKSTEVPADFEEFADEFDMLAQSRTLEHKTTQNIEKSSGNNHANAQEFQREQDVHEVARWLEDKPEEPGAPKTDEFDRFLAARAAAAERLPTVNQSTVEKESTNSKPLTPLKS